MVYGFLTFEYGGPGREAQEVDGGSIKYHFVYLHVVIVSMYVRM